MTPLSQALLRRSRHVLLDTLNNFGIVFRRAAAEKAGIRLVQTTSLSATRVVTSNLRLSAKLTLNWIPHSVGFKASLMFFLTKYLRSTRWFVECFNRVKI